MNTPAATALAEYARRKERAAIDVAQHPARRARAEANLRAWLAVVLLSGADHSDAAALLAWHARPGADGTPGRADRAAAASWLCPHRAWLPHLVHAAAQALADADARPAPETAARWKALRALCAALGHFGPFTNATPAHPERKAA